MISKKLLGLAALAAAASLAPSAFAAAPVSGSIAAMTITINDRVVDGLPATTTVNLAGDAATVVSTCSGQVRATIDALGNRSVRTYDVAGRLLSVRDATGAGTDYAYDALGRKLTETDAAIAGKVRRYAYDKIGRLISTTDATGVTTTYAYDVRDRKVSDATPMNGSETRVIRYGYDVLGRMVTLTDANGAVTTWGYDEVGRQVAKAYANGDHRSMAYDAAGRLVKLTDENGHDITSSYDLAGRLLAKAYAADSTADTFVYDAASRMTSVTKGRYNHTLRYAYDPAGRLCSEIHPDGRVVNLRYDAAGRTRRVFLADGETSYVPSWYDAAYTYDTRGLLAKVSYGDYATRYEYRENGQLASTIDYRVIDPQGDILRADRTYDAGARLLGVANTAANGDQSGVVYTLGVDDQRLTVVEESGQKWNYGYDGLKQLVTARKTDTAASVVPPLDQSYTYDPMGNRRAHADQAGSTAYTANSVNQYTVVGGIASVYDHNGNLLSDGVKNYVWDAENQLIAVTPVSPGEGSQRVEYTYDWRMRRTEKKSYTYGSGTWGLTKATAFKYHEWNPIQEIITDAATSAATSKYYVWGNDLRGSLHSAGGVGGLLAMSSAGATHFHVYDGNGNVRALVKADAVNPSVSAITARYAYDGFGKEVAVSGVDADKNSFRFSTKQLDAETGMNYYGYRFYVANAGRWINRDPIDERGGMNIYAQCSNGVINSVDVNGLWKTPVHHTIAAAWLKGREVYSIKYRCRGSYREYHYDVLGNVNMGSDIVDGVEKGESFLDILLNAENFASAQSSETAYQHAMRSPNQSPAEAEVQYNNYVSTKLQEAAYQMKLATDSIGIGGLDSGMAFATLQTMQGVIDNSFRALGGAFHAISDFESPAHSKFQVWYGPIDGVNYFGAKAFVQQYGVGPFTPDNHFLSEIETLAYISSRGTTDYIEFVNEHAAQEGAAEYDALSAASRASIVDSVAGKLDPTLKQLTQLGELKAK